MKKHIKIILVTLILFASVITINKVKVKADSGWDTSYDSSSSYDSGSSWDSDYSSGDYSSSGEGNPASALIVLIILILFIAFFVISSKKAKKELLEKEKEQNKEKNDLSMKYLNMSVDELCNEIKDKFIKIQNAWMNFDYDTLKKLCNNEIYNTYYEELEALKLKQQQNIMNDFNIRVIIEDIVLENNIITVNTKLVASFYDYVIDTTDKKVIKGTNKLKICNTYELEFTKSISSVDTCPNCGAKVEVGTTVCEYCKAVLVQESNELVMSKKKIVMQRR